MDIWFSSTIVVIMIVVSICMIVALVKSIVGPGLSNRLVAVNMIGTMVNVLILLLTVYLGEDWLIDVAILYTALSFLAVIVLCKIFTGVYREKNSTVIDNKRQTKAEEEKK